MKKIFLSIAVVSFLAGCKNDSFLDIPVEGQTEESAFFKTQDDALKATNAIYSFLRGWENFKEKNGKELKKNTQNYHLIALRAFLKYLAKRDIKTLSPEKIELGKMPERVVDFLEGSDLERLLEAPTTVETPEIIKKRDKAILEMLFSTGLRVSELANLKKEQVNLKNQCMRDILLMLPT